MRESPSGFPEPPPAMRAAIPDGGAWLQFSDVLRRLGRELDRGEEEMNVAIRAVGARSDLPPGQLIALQIGVYRYSNAVDLASRLVDRATGAIKTVLQANGQ